jgi:hypothetical protein
MNHLVRMYFLLMTLNDKSYTPGVYCSLLVWAYQRRTNGFAWKMFVENASICNEECGEISFSLLARCHLGSSSVSKIEQVNKTYRDLRTYVTASKEMRLGQHLSEFHQGGRATVKDDDESIGATVEYFRGVIRALKVNTHQAYDGSRAGYRSKAAANSHQIPLARQIWFLDTAIDARRHEIRTKIIAKLDTFWTFQFKDIWPEASEIRPGASALVGVPLPPLEQVNDEEDGKRNDNDSGSESGDTERSDHSARDDNADDQPRLSGDDDDEKHHGLSPELSAHHNRDMMNDLMQNGGREVKSDDEAETDVDNFDERMENLSPDERDAQNPIGVRERLHSAYYALPQSGRDQVWRAHNSVDASNVVQGKRSRKRRN